jgi:hypothetical protein
VKSPRQLASDRIIGQQNAATFTVINQEFRSHFLWMDTTGSTRHDTLFRQMARTWDATPVKYLIEKWQKRTLDRFLTVKNAFFLYGLG